MMDQDTKLNYIAFSIILCLVTIFIIQAALKRRRHRRDQAAARAYHEHMRAQQPPSIADLQIQAVNEGTFTPQKLMNGGEYNVFLIAEAMLKNSSYRVCPQVSLGEILSAKGDAYRAINSKRVDMVIIDARGWPKVAIEIQGSGHYQGNALQRDAIKRTALQKAGIDYLEMTGNESMEEVGDKIWSKLSRDIKLVSSE